MSGYNRTKKQAFFSRDARQLPQELLNSVNENPISRIRAPSPLKALTPNQKAYLKKLRQAPHDILFATGPAGCGKTYMATRVAIEKFQNGDYNKMIIARPNVGAGDDLGYLPGNLIEKMAPWMQPILDVFKECYAVHEVERMIRSEEIEIAPLVFCRGRTFKNAIIIGDEMQNATPEQMKMFLTRIGEGSQMVITGDMEQHDRLEGGVSGLQDIVDRLAKRDTLPVVITAPAGVEPVQRPDRLGYVRLGKADVVRHPVIEEVLDLYL